MKRNINSFFRHPLKNSQRYFWVICISFLFGGQFLLADVGNTDLDTTLMASQQLISGKVVDETGAPLAGASVVEKGTTNGVAADFDGNFSIQVADDAILLVSYVGYREREINADTDLSEIQLELDVNSLDEIVVTGYGSSKRKDVTGSISSVSSAEVNQGALTNPLQLISGKAAGVVVNQTGSEPGNTPSIRIRGITSLIGGNDPLVVVDGAQAGLDILNLIPPSEIASFDILKDASATAVYGSRGAAGVIIITTKRNKAGTSTVEYMGNTSVDFIPKELNLLSAAQWSEQARINNVPASANLGSDTDWYGLLTQGGSTFTHNLAFGGGTDTFNYRASLTAIEQNGVVINSNNQKYIGRLTATQKALNDKLTLNFNLYAGIIENRGTVQSIGRASFTSNLISNAYFQRPTDPVLDVDGSFFSDPNVFQYLNPYAVAQTVVDEGKEDNILGNFKVDFELFQGFTLGWFGSWRKKTNTLGFFLPVESTSANAIDQGGFANIRNDRQDEKLTNISASFKKEFGNQAIDLLALYEWQNQTFQGNFAQARGFINDITTFNALQLGDASAARPGDVTSFKNDRTLASFLGRVNYSLLDRYLLTLSYRRDGSSVFGENNKWGDFPSASVAWQLDQEPFMKNLSAVNQLKLRGGYGITGNQQGLPPQGSLPLVGGSGVVFFGGQQITNFNVTQNANADLQWETKKQLNLGIDFAMFDNRLRGTLDVFTATTDNLLFNYTVPQPPFPFNTILANVGSVLNEGVEVFLAYDVISTDNTTLTLAGNVSLLRNEVQNLSGSINGVALNTNFVPWGPDSFLIEGEAIGTFNTLTHTGTDDANVETVLDVNGDGIIDQGAQSPDRTLNGSALPTYTYAFNPTFKHKNFDVSMLWRGSGGNKVYNGLRRNLSLLETLGRSNLLESAVDLGIFTSPYNSDLWLEDGSFLRLENLTAGYTINFNRIKYLDSMRLSVTGNNLILITDYTGIDPELNFSGSNGFGGDNGIYPRTRSVVVGLDIKLN